MDTLFPKEIVYYRVCVLGDEVSALKVNRKLQNLEEDFGQKCHSERADLTCASELIKCLDTFTGTNQHHEHV